MSILIKGLDMPTDGELLCINIHPDGKVCINLDLECKKVGDAVPVPPHGRLGDLDSLELKMRNRKYKYGRESDPDCLVVDAPTIIPVEKEVEKNFCGDCHWYEAEEQYCFRNGCHAYNESTCEHWEPVPADEPIPAPGGKTDPTTYDLLYEEGGYSGNGI